MIERRGEKVVLITPVTPEDVAELQIGDVIYLDGDLVTCRDVAHRRLICGKRQLPVDLNGKAIFHAGPIMVPDQTSGSGFKVVSIGPTTSMRMEKFEKEFIEQTGVKLIVGKGGMGPNTVEGCTRFKALHCVFPGGCAVLAAQCVEEVEDVQWPELGMPESLWVMRVKEFGPLIVSIDTHGGNLFEQNKKVFNERKAPIVEEVIKKTEYID